jgi:hypothetical protein
LGAIAVSDDSVAIGDDRLRVLLHFITALQWVTNLFYYDLALLFLFFDALKVLLKPARIHLLALHAHLCRNISIPVELFAPFSDLLSLHLSSLLLHPLLLHGLLFDYFHVLDLFHLYFVVALDLLLLHLEEADTIAHLGQLLLVLLLNHVLVEHVDSMGIQEFFIIQFDALLWN